MKKTELSETDLLKCSQAGDHACFEVLMQPYKQKIQNFLAKMCRDDNAVDDMLQETMLNVFNNIKSFRGEAKFSTWVFQIATNNCRMLKRKTGSQPVASLDAPLNDSEKLVVDTVIDQTIDDYYARVGNRELVEAALWKIPEDYRAALLLKDVEGFKANEIAKLLHISLPNAKARILRARAMLFNLLKDKF